jgi:hypothetical protein
LLLVFLLLLRLRLLLGCSLLILFPTWSRLLLVLLVLLLLLQLLLLLVLLLLFQLLLLLRLLRLLILLLLLIQRQQLKLLMCLVMALVAFASCRAIQHEVCIHVRKVILIPQVADLHEQQQGAGSIALVAMAYH